MFLDELILRVFSFLWGIPPNAYAGFIYKIDYDFEDGKPCKVWVTDIMTLRKSCRVELISIYWNRFIWDFLYQNFITLIYFIFYPRTNSIFIFDQM